MSPISVFLATLCVSLAQVPVPSGVVARWDDSIFKLGTDGSEIWRFDSGCRVMAQAASADGTIYVTVDCARETGSLLAFSSGGEVLWNFTVPCEGAMSVHQSCLGDALLLGESGTLFFSRAGKHVHTPAGYESKPGRLYAVSTGGELQWSTEVSDGGLEPTLGVDGAVYVLDPDHFSLRCLSAADGGERWHRPELGAQPNARQVGADGTIFLPIHGDLVALSSEGKTLWNRTLSTSKYDYPSVVLGADGTVYAYEFDSSFKAYGWDGEEKWVLNMSGVGGYSDPSQQLVAGDFLMQVGYSGDVIRVRPDGSNGTFHRFKNFSAGTYHHPLVGQDGTVYIQTGQASQSTADLIIALKPDGSTKWQVRANGSPVFSKDGTMYMYTWDQQWIEAEHTWISTRSLIAVSVVDGSLRWQKILSQTDEAHAFV